MKLVLKKFFNSTLLVSPKKALELYEAVVSSLKKGNELVLDFEGIKATTLVFHYVFYSKLYESFGKELKQKIQIKNASKEMIDLLMHLQRNYKELSVKFSGVLMLG